MSADGHVQGELPSAYSDLRLEPLSPLGDEVDYCDGRLQHVSRKFGYVVERSFLFGIEDAVAAERRKAIDLFPPALGTEIVHQELTLFA
jgi:hypothetical protein